MDYLDGSGEAGVRGSEEIAMRDYSFLRDVSSGIAGELVGIQG